MKEIIAIIRMQNVNETKRALVDIGVYGMTAVKVMGRGKMAVDFSVLNGNGEEVHGLIEDTLAGGGRFIPKRLFNIMVPDEQAKQVVDTIIRVNHQGKKGDGKIFVLPLDNVIRIRTGEKGAEAI